jgi:hypothetical protein
MADANEMGLAYGGCMVSKRALAGGAVPDEEQR